jgi:hypothetical protein
VSRGDWRPPQPDPFVELGDDERLRAAISARQEGRDRRDRAAEVATWVGTLRDLAERRIGVVVRLAADRVHRGSLAAVGRDHVALRLASGSMVLLMLDTIRSVRPEPGRAAPVAMGDRGNSQDRTLVEALERLAEQGTELVLALRDTADPVNVRIVGLGEDVLTVRTAGGDASTIYVPITALREILIPR